MERICALLLLLFTLPTQAAVQMYYLHNDHLGTPRLVTSQQQAVVWRGQLKPFGETKVEVEAITNHRRLPGQRFDIESRLYYNYFRDYDPSTGRYIQSDPIGLAGGLNIYAYVGGNPLLSVDPMGLYWFRQPGQKRGVVGRDFTMVPPRGRISELLEKHVPAGYTFGQMHDNFVSMGKDLGYPDWMINIPTMLPMFQIALTTEVLRTFGILDQQSISAQQVPMSPCP